MSRLVILELRGQTLSFAHKWSYVLGFGNLWSAGRFESVSHELGVCVSYFIFINLIQVELELLVRFCWFAIKVVISC